MIIWGGQRFIALKDINIDRGHCLKCVQHYDFLKDDMS